MASRENLPHACAESNSYTITNSFFRLQTTANGTNTYNKRVITLIYVNIVSRWDIYGRSQALRTLASSRPSIFQLGTIFTDISAIALYYHIFVTILCDNPNFAYVIMCFPPFGYQPAAGNHVFKRREVIMPGCDVCTSR